MSILGDYNRELKRIRRFIKGAEKRGYRFESTVIPKRVKRPTKASVAKLKKITPERLYSKSTALSESGKVVSGTEYRKFERSQSAKKASITRKLKSGDFKKQRAEQDRIDVERLQSDREWADMFREGRIIYFRIQQMISEVDYAHQKAADHLRSVLEAEIKQFGEDKVFRNISNAPDFVIELADIALRYNPGDSRHDDSIRELLMIITGSVPSTAELNELQEAIDADVYVD